MLSQANEMFASLFGGIQPADEPKFQIRCNYRQVDGIGTASFLLPQLHTSDANCQVTLEVLRNLGEDTALMVREYHGPRGRGMVPGSATLSVESARG